MLGLLCNMNTDVYYVDDEELEITTMMMGVRPIVEKLVQALATELSRKGLGKSKGHAFACQAEEVKVWNGKGFGGSAEFWDDSPCSKQCLAIQEALKEGEDYLAATGGFVSPTESAGSVVRTRTSKRFTVRPSLD